MTSRQLKEYFTMTSVQPRLPYYDIDNPKSTLHLGNLKNTLL